MTTRYIAFYRSGAPPTLDAQRQAVEEFLAANGAVAEEEFTDNLGEAWTRAAGRAVLLVATLDCLHANPRALWAYLDHPKVLHPNFWAVDMPDMDAMLGVIVRGIAAMDAAHHLASVERRRAAAGGRRGS